MQRNPDRYPSAHIKPLEGVTMAAGAAISLFNPHLGLGILLPYGVDILLRSSATGAGVNVPEKTTLPVAVLGGAVLCNFLVEPWNPLGGHLPDNLLTLAGIGIFAATAAFAHRKDRQ